MLRLATDARSLRRHVGKDHDGEFQTFGLMDRHQPDAVAAFLEDRRFPGFAALGLLAQLVDEARETKCRLRLRSGAPDRLRAHVGEHLLAAMLERKADVRAGGFEQRGNRRRHRT